jgi:ribonuclease-3
VSGEGDGRGRLEAALGHVFRDAALLETALTHPSWAHEQGGGRGNERLEFLGDAVLDLVVAELLYAEHPERSEGELTRARAALVNRRALAERARALELGSELRLGRTEQRTAGAKKSSILANVYEAVLGALYLDAGLEAVRRFVEDSFGAAVRQGAGFAPDAKTRFQEWAHAALRATPTYQALRDSGVEGDPERFETQVRVGAEVFGQGAGRTKRAAELAAAAQALHRLEAAGAEGAGDG